MVKDIQQRVLDALKERPGAQRETIANIINESNRDVGAALTALHRRNKVSRVLTDGKYKYTVYMHDELINICNIWDSVVRCSIINQQRG